MASQRPVEPANSSRQWGRHRDQIGALLSPSLHKVASRVSLTNLGTPQKTDAQAMGVRPDLKFLAQHFLYLPVD